MKAKVLKDFNDKYTGRRYKKDEVISVSKERFDEILTVDNLVEAVAEEVVEEKTMPEVMSEALNEKPKKATRKATKSAK